MKTIIQICDVSFNRDPEAALAGNVRVTTCMKFDAGEAGDTWVVADPDGAETPITGKSEDALAISLAAYLGETLTAASLDLS